MIKTAIVYVAAAFFEIAGCFSFWIWIREGKAGWWLAPGVASLALFAWLLTQTDTAAAGRAYAAYGEGVRPDHWDVLGALICLVGAAVILFGPRVAT